MYVILTSKPGQFRTEIGDDLRTVESYDYLFYGRRRAHFVITELACDTKVQVIDESEPETVNHVPTKFLQKFHDLDAARRELKHLCSFGSMDIVLVKREPACAEPGARRSHATDMISIIFITNNNKAVAAPENSNLLRVSLKEKGGIPFKCGGGLCGTCKCRIERGLEHTDDVKPKERKHLSDAQLTEGYRMACQTFVRGDIAVSW